MASGYVNHAFSAASNRVIQKESIHGPDKNLLSGFGEKVSSEKKSWKEKGPCFAGEGCRTKQRLK